MKKHTPAPWEATFFAKTHAVHAKSGDCVAVCDSATAENEANARLIAAAPELLEALIELIPLIEVTFPKQQEVWLTQARAAIAKAKGES